MARGATVFRIRMGLIFSRCWNLITPLRRTLRRSSAQRSFSKLLQYLLLTAARRNEAARMDRQECTGADWLIPTAKVKGAPKREFLFTPLKGRRDAAGWPSGNPGRQIGPLFATDGERPLAAFNQFKKAFAALLLARALDHP